MGKANRKNTPKGKLSGPTNVEEIFAIISTGTSVSGTMLAKARIYGAIGADQIIANHTIVDKYSDIPQIYIDEVKKRWLSYAGESHSEAIRTGLLALETAESKYAVSVVESGTPQPYTTANLRASRGTWGLSTVLLDGYTITGKKIGIRAKLL
jgi:hypothetical protein